jgi:hypothetical protein
MDDNLYTTWVLEKVTAFTENIDYPKTTVRFIKPTNGDKPTAEIITGKKKFQNVKFTIEELQYYYKEDLKYKSTKSYNITPDEYLLGPEQEFNFLRGSFQICKDALKIDNGSAADGAIFYFRKK